MDHVFPPPQPTETFPYRIEAKIGEGGMGRVYRALEPALGRCVAIKVLRSEMLAGDDHEAAEDARLRFVREGRAAAGLSHPGITTIYRVGEEGGNPFIAMEWLDGDTLETLLQQGSLGIRDVVRLVIALLDTLEAAHQKGVVHRDIKPANLVVLRDGRLKVTDFGIARVQAPDQLKTQAGMVLGTPRFASPEQLRGEEVDGRSDIFSVGVILYLALTGTPPFAGRSFLELATAVLRTEPVAPRQANPAIPSPLEAVVLRALAKKCEDRFASAAEMAEALRPIAGDTGSTTGVSGVRTPAPQISAPTGALRPVLVGLPRHMGALVAQAAQTWPAKALGEQPTLATLERLMERPLHAPPFAGAVRFGRALVLMHDGCVVGAVDAVSRATGDEVVEALPARADATLLSVPTFLPAGVVPLLATLLARPRVRQTGLDPSFVDLPALARKLAEERFDGLLRLRRGNATGLVLLSGGQEALSLFTDGWEDVPTAQPWESWVAKVPLEASLEARNATISSLCLRRELANVELVVEPPPKGLATTQVRPVSADTGDLAADPAFRFLSWALDALPRFFAERGRTDRWKYLAEWLPLVRRARLHHQLPRPGAPETDFFDLVTFDPQGKVLHLAHRVARVTPRNLREFVQRVTLAKTARLKGGDIGAAILIAPAFDIAAVGAYRNATVARNVSRWSFEDALTRYEGFVRIGARRGFHLLLVSEGPEGFEPILPD